MTTGERRSHSIIWTNFSCSRPRENIRYFYHIYKKLAGLSGTHVDDILRTRNQSFKKYSTKLAKDAFDARKPVETELGSKKTPTGRGACTFLAETPIGGKTETWPTYCTEHGLEVAVVEQDRGGRTHAREAGRLDAPERYWLTIQYRRAGTDPTRGRAARVLNPRVVPLVVQLRERVSATVNVQRYSKPCRHAHTCSSAPRQPGS